MRGSLTRAVLGALVAAGGVACEPGEGPLVAPCAEADVFVSTEPPACDETFCGPPAVQAGTGEHGFEAVEEGEDVPLVHGAGNPGPYMHIWLAARMRQLCPVVWLDVGADVVEPDGRRTALYTERRRVQAVRYEDGGSLQDFWGLRAQVACEWLPADAPELPGCAQPGERGDISELPVVLWARATDDNGRTGEAEATVRPYCCAGVD